MSAVSQARPTAAVVGSGVAGLTAAYLLQRRYDVTLYEGAGRLGGHADTHEVTAADGRSLLVDTGFIVHSTRTYPALTRLLGELGVMTQPAQMSMSVRCLGCGLEYAGSRGMRGLTSRAGLRGRPEYLRLLATVPRFYRGARGLLGADSGPAAELFTLRDFLRAGGYGRYFTSHFVQPLVAAVWSCSPAQALEYPARYLFEFLDHHDMLTLRRSADWRTITGGSQSYVEQIAKQLTSVRTGTAVRAVRRSGTGVQVTAGEGDTTCFDAAVIATHPDQALALLAEPTRAEAEVLGAFRYTPSTALLHTDTSVLPRRKSAQASWNYLLKDCAATAAQVQVSYDLSRLQQLEPPDRFVLTLNGGRHVSPAAVIDEMTYRHPLYTTASVAAQRRLGELNSAVLAYAGAYHGWGFHEDGCRAGVTAAASLGVRW